MFSLFYLGGALVGSILQPNHALTSFQYLGRQQSIHIFVSVYPPLASTHESYENRNLVVKLAFVLRGLLHPQHWTVPPILLRLKHCSAS